MLKKFVVESHETIYYKTIVIAENEDDAMDKIQSWTVEPTIREDIGNTEIDDVYEIDNDYYDKD